MNELTKMYGDSRTSIDNLPESLREYLPRSKADVATVRKLKELNREQLKPLLPHLLSWIQDTNWLVSREVAPFLVSTGSDIIPEIEWVLKGDDDRWKGSCIRCVLCDLHPVDIEPLLPILKRIAETPTAGEKEEEADDDAKICIENVSKI